MRRAPMQGTDAGVLSRTRGFYDPEFDIWAWPVGCAPGELDDDLRIVGSLAELVESGEFSQQEADELRVLGGLGWEIGLDGRGRWTFLVSGD